MGALQLDQVGSNWDPELTSVQSWLTGSLQTATHSVSANLWASESAWESNWCDPGASSFSTGSAAGGTVTVDALDDGEEGYEYEIAVDYDGYDYSDLGYPSYHSSDREAVGRKVGLDSGAVVALWSERRSYNEQWCTGEIGWDPNCNSNFQNGCEDEQSAGVRRVAPLDGAPSQTLVWLEDECNGCGRWYVDGVFRGILCI